MRAAVPGRRRRLHFEPAVADVADDARFRLQLQVVVGVTGPLTLPLTTTCDTVTSPSTRACSLMTSVPGSPPAVVTLPCTWPSMRSPPVNDTSPRTTVPAPIRLSIRFCGARRLAAAEHGASVPVNQMGRQRGVSAASRRAGGRVAPPPSCSRNAASLLERAVLGRQGRSPAAKARLRAARDREVAFERRIARAQRRDFAAARGDGRFERRHPRLDLLAVEAAEDLAKSKPHHHMPATTTPPAPRAPAAPHHGIGVRTAMRGALMPKWPARAAASREPPRETRLRQHRRRGQAGGLRQARTSGSCSGSPVRRRP